MKILFAVNNDNISEAIVKKYQKEYKEILSFKNVYYFNAICRELQKDKSYSRIVIGEDLEPFANNDYNSIDKFLFEKYSNIVEEAKNINNNPIDIILICSDRRRKTDDMLVKLYNKGIYNAIIGQDRSIDEVCRLINNPRDKEEAKAYYNIKESELGDTESETNVSEAEVENIRAHYARLGKNEDKYLESFNNIVAQYNDAQLKIIIKYLPMNVKAVLEERSPKYQQLVTTSALGGIDAKGKTEAYKEQLKNKKNEEDIVEQLIKPNRVKNVVIPKNIASTNVKKIEIPEVTQPEVKVAEEPIQAIQDNSEKTVKTENEEIELPKRGRGRPRKKPVIDKQETEPKRGRGRPRKNSNDNTNNVNEKAQEPVEVDLFNMEEQPQEHEEQEPEVDLFDMDQTPQEEPEVDLFNMDETSPKQDEQEVNLFDIDENKEQEEKPAEDELFNAKEEPAKQEDNYITKTNNVNNDLNTLFTSDKKMVAFVGTTKNGTSFVVNNTAEMLASMGIETAILDLTKNKNAYYIYTNNEETLRNIARNCMANLQDGIAEGIKVNKHLTIYTEMPGEEQEYNIENVLQTLLKSYSAILIDTDFETNPEIFQKVQEIYLVQTMDVLTIQPLTAFLRNLKSNNILQPEKLRIVINKSERVRNLSLRTLIGGMSCYNSPSMTYMTELFNKDNIRYCEIPFEVENYVKYLNSLVECSISLKGYTKKLLNSLNELANMVYPLINKSNFSRREEPFSNQVNETLNKMKNRY